MFTVKYRKQSFYIYVINIKIIDVSFQFAKSPRSNQVVSIFIELLLSYWKHIYKKIAELV